MGLFYSTRIKSKSFRLLRPFHWVIFIVVILILPKTVFSRQTTVTVSISDTLKGAPGDTIAIPVRLNHPAEKISALGAVITTDGGFLKYLLFTKGPIVPGTLLDIEASRPDSLRLAFVDFGGGPIIQSGVLATLYFQIASNAVAGATSILALDVLSAADSLGTSFKVIGINGKVTVMTRVAVAEKQENLPVEFALSQNYPNPVRASALNPAVTIRFQIPASSLITLKVYGLLGQEVATILNDWRSAGSHEVNWQPQNLTKGIYFYRLQAGTIARTKKLAVN